MDENGKLYAPYTTDAWKKGLEFMNELYAQIASLVGFVSKNTFYRNFQEITGVTPKTYRDQLKP